MNTYRIFSLKGKTLRFRGDLLLTVKSGRIETACDCVWFELKAYQCASNPYVITITSKRADAEIDEVFDFYHAANIIAVEDFLYDFNPSIILPVDIVAAKDSSQTSAMVSADHAYYAAARSLVRKLNDHAAKQELSGELSKQSPLSIRPSGLTDTTQPKHWVVNRIRSLFGI